MALRLKERLIKKIDSCHSHKRQISHCQREVNARTKGLRVEIDSVIEDEIKPIKEQEKRNAERINWEIDRMNDKHFDEIRRHNEEIRKNNDERRRRLENNKTDSECQQAPILYKRRELFGDIRNITEAMELEIAKLEKSLQDCMAILENAKRTHASPRATRDHEHGTHVFHQSVTDALRMPLVSLDVDRLTRLTRMASGLKFVKGAGMEKINGRIDGYDGDWRLIDKVNINHPNAETTFKLPILVGNLDASRVLITDRGGHRNTYVLDVTTKRARRVIVGSDKSYVSSCALLSGGRTVCGKRRIGCTSQNLGTCLTGCISVYDGHWKLMNDLTIPRNTSRDDTWIDVAADPEGKIIAAEWGQSKIYVLDPDTQNIVNTITCAHNIVIRGVQPSGHIIARPSSADSKLFKIDRTGAQTEREIPCKDVVRNVCVDPLTDALYAVTSDVDYKRCVIDQVIWKGGHESKKRRVVSIDLSPTLMQAGVVERRSHLVLSKIIMTPSGKIIACNGNEIICITKDIQFLR